jgi:hypothetical protein
MRLITVFALRYRAFLQATKSCARHFKMSPNLPNIGRHHVIMWFSMLRMVIALQYAGGAFDLFN